MELDAGILKAMAHLCEQINAFKFVDADDYTGALKLAEAIHHLAESLGDEGLKEETDGEDDDE